MTAPESKPREHTTHYDDCGCLSARYEADLARVTAERDEARAEIANAVEVELPALVAKAKDGINELTETFRVQLAERTAALTATRAALKDIGDAAKALDDSVPPQVTENGRVPVGVEHLYALRAALANPVTQAVMREQAEKGA